MAYQTKQQQAVLRCLQLRAEECLSAADLSEELRHGGLTVGLATVYRQLDKLTQQGLVHKVTTEEGRSTNTVRRQAIPRLLSAAVRGLWADGPSGLPRIWRRSAVISPPEHHFVLTPAAPC